MSKYTLAVLKLFTAGVIWGLSFTLVRWALGSFSTSQLLFWRLLVSFIIGEALLFLFNRKLFSQSHSDIKSACYIGLALGLSLLFQIHGLNFTTATKSAFITTTYVIMIPFFAFILFKQKIKIYDVILAALALIGMTFLLDLFNGSSFSAAHLNFGDLLTVASAATAAVQIILIGIYAKFCVSPFRFNTYQNFWSLVAVLPFMFYEMTTQHISMWPESVSTQSLLGLVGLIFLVSILAFYLQVSAQKHLSTTTASMLCLLEAPFSFLFATMLLQETINSPQAFGALIIILSAFLSTYFGKPSSSASVV